MTSESSTQINTTKSGVANWAKPHHNNGAEPHQNKTNTTLVQMTFDSSTLIYSTKSGVANWAKPHHNKTNTMLVEMIRESSLLISTTNSGVADWADPLFKVAWPLIFTTSFKWQDHYFYHSFYHSFLKVVVLPLWISNDLSHVISTYIFSGKTTNWAKPHQDHQLS